MFKCEERRHLRYSSQDMFDSLIGLGYRGSFFFRVKLQPLERLPELGLAILGSSDVNNFSFFIRQILHKRSLEHSEIP